MELSESRSPRDHTRMHVVRLLVLRYDFKGYGILRKDWSQEFCFPDLEQSTDLARKKWSDFFLDGYEK